MSSSFPIRWSVRSLEGATLLGGEDGFGSTGAAADAALALPLGTPYEIVPIPTESSSSALPESPKRFSFDESVLSLENLCMIAEMQNGSNLSGLLHSWAALLPVIRESALRAGIPPNQHPINVIMLDKLSQLANSDTGEACLALGWLSRQIDRLTPKS